MIQYKHDDAVDYISRKMVGDINYDIESFRKISMNNMIKIVCEYQLEFLEKLGYKIKRG